MLKAYALPIAFMICISAQLDGGSLSLSWQSETAQLSEEQNNVTLEDQCTAAVAGFCGAYLTTFLASYIYCDCLKNHSLFAPALCTALLYGSLSKKLINKADQRLHMFGWGGLLGSCIIAARACRFKVHIINYFL